MSRKIVCDIQKKTSFKLSLEEKDLKKTKRLSRNILDLSLVGKSKVVRETSGQDKMNDIAEKKSSFHQLPKQKIVFLHIDPEKKVALDRVGEMIRLVATGILILFCINLANIIPRGIQTKDNLIMAATNGYSNLLSGGNQAQKTQFNDAGNSFTQAEKNFQNALDAISFLSAQQNIFATKEKTVQSVRGILEAGKSISQAGQDFSKGIETLRTLPALFLNQNKESIFDKKIENNQDPKFNQETTLTKVSLTSQLKTDLEFLTKAVSEVEIASDNLALVDVSVLPDNLKQKFQSLQEKVQTLKNYLHLAQEKIPLVLKMLGDRYLHRYLILLQNDAESRPTGGFIGSYLLLDINDGEITKAEFHDVYETDGQLKENIPAPEDIAKITKDWRLRDSNYSPDFAFSAEKAAWFLQKEKGPSVDTVIAINQHFLASFFDITGPIKLEGLNAALTKENYQTIISYIVESKLSGEQDPKKILRSFIPEFQKKLFSSSEWQKILTKVLEGAAKGDLLFYSRDSEIEGLFDELGLSGKIIRTKPEEDYFHVTNTSVGGNKSDSYMSQDLIHSTYIGVDGSVNDEVTITRKHSWTKQSLENVTAMLKSFGFDQLPEGVKFILGAGKNKTMMKVYVPVGSVLLNSDGIDQKDILTREDFELQKTYFMFEMDTEPGSEKKVSLSYQLPLKLNVGIADSYKFFTEPQPGIIVTHFHKNIFINPSLILHGKYPEDLTQDENKNPILDQDLTKDIYMSVLVGK